MTNGKRLKRLQKDLEWFQVAVAKHIAANLKLPFDDKSPDVSAIQDAYQGSSDPIGDIQNVLDDISDDTEGTVAHLIDLDPLVDNFCGVEMRGDNKDGYSVKVLDRVSMMEFWMDVWISDHDIQCDWNQYIFHTNDEDDRQRQKMQSKGEFFADAESAACAYLEEGKFIVQNNDCTWRYGKEVKKPCKHH